MYRDRIERFAEGFAHPSWGVSHCKRVYEVASTLAREEGLVVDDDVLHAVAYLHDAGAFDAWKVDGCDQAECSARAAEAVLPELDFPAAKTPIVAEVIRGHSFEFAPGPRPEARVFHDADILDFMGSVGVTRLLSIVGIEDWTPDVQTAVGVIAQFADELPPKLVLPAAEQLAATRGAEMRLYLYGLRQETAVLAAL